MAAILNFKMAANMQVYMNARVDFFIQLVVTNNMPEGITSTLFRMRFAPSHHTIAMFLHKSVCNTSSARLRYMILRRP